jgi:hypothetical protein
MRLHLLLLPLLHALLLLLCAGLCILQDSSHGLAQRLDCSRQ